jgi:hypothetical protein
MHTTHELHPVDLKSSKIVIALAQISGPFPHGKHKSVINSRETLSWQSLGDMQARVEKIIAILDALSEAALRPDIVVFPEYSFPVTQALPELQAKANQYAFIIVAGADSLWQPNLRDIYNQSPIFIPGRGEPLWVTKRDVSQWEEGLVDEPTYSKRPILTWNAGGHEYWIATHICLDFQRAADEFEHGGGVFLVPMCSPDVMPFLGCGKEPQRCCATASATMHKGSRAWWR